MTDCAMGDTVQGSKQCEVVYGPMDVDGFSLQASNKLESDGKDLAKENVSKKRKRISSGSNLTDEEKKSLIFECQRELGELFELYKEVSSYKLHQEDRPFLSINVAVSNLLEESSLSFSKLVEDIYCNLKVRQDNLEISLASVRSAVLSVGQRMMYGIVDEDVDVLEDESEKCLWCWEARDLKFLPKTQRGFFNARRLARRRIHERICAISTMISALSNPQTLENYKNNVRKASQRLAKVSNVTLVRSLVENLMQRSSTEMAEKEAKLKEKELIKERERNMQIAEKEKKRIDREIQKEKQLAEKELKKLQEEAVKEEKRREKEEAELRKHIEKQEKQAKKDQWRQEKEAAELKKQLTLQKQASIMESFLKCKNANKYVSIVSTKEATISEEPCRSEGEINTIIFLMDYALSRHESLPLDDLRRSHILGWRKACSRNRSNRWGVRRKPKVNLFQELKLQGSSSEAESPPKFEVADKNHADRKTRISVEPLFDLQLIEHAEAVSNSANSSQVSYRPIRKLLQFDKSNRPAYYGTWSRKSGTVGPRHPLQKDPGLDYEVESDEEWEEEEPGESLSDCEKDKEDELLDEEILKDDGSESEDSFLVPDGYLSENEGVPDGGTSDGMGDESRSSTYPQLGTETEVRAVLQQQRHLNNLTEQALRKSHPLIITNLMHEKDAYITADGLDGTARIEQICLQALCIRAFPGASTIDISNVCSLDEDQAHSLSQDKLGIGSSSPVAVIPDSDLIEYVRAIQSSPSINKVVESMQQKNSNISKSYIRKVVRNISDFADNRWQVKKEVLNKLGLSISPEKNNGRAKGISMFFSKRCLPPKEEPMNLPGGSAQQCNTKEDLRVENHRNTGLQPL
ncbi:Chromatin assembly factor 1 subunit FSM [Apostasia shenzhenica]|uniref:Chromatin assembly factor 1 subunit FSM n=1 Tax=Apostasia shenzhenica TaxID=1088818 RepID=A0A2I0ALB6_9ASPA|nr:Chromatin assembly factor 1 subunit FSM [Apostasia shenzhenica]